MRAAYLLLLGLIGISPALLIVDGPMIHALLVAYAAVAVALVGALIRPGEAGYLASVIRPIAIIAAILAVWLMVQLIPLPIKSWAHPIWAGAETALGTPIASGITIDPGATLVAICRYFSAIAILFVATAVTIDRMRAERVLFWLVGATTLAAVVQIIHGLVAFEFLDEATDARIRESTTALCALGVIMAATAVVRAIERYETRRTEIDVPFTKFAIAPGLAIVAFGICALSLAIFSPAPVSFAAASGLATLAILMGIRRLGFEPLGGRYYCRDGDRCCHYYCHRYCGNTCWIRRRHASLCIALRIVADFDYTAHHRGHRLARYGSRDIRIAAANLWEFQYRHRWNAGTHHRCTNRNRIGTACTLGHPHYDNRSLVSAVTRRAATWPGFVLSGRRSRLYRRFDARGILRCQSLQHCSPHLYGGRFRPRPCPACKSHEPMTGR